MGAHCRIFFLGLMLLLTGCIPSLHPLYTPEDLIFDDALLGEWVDKDGKETWTFAKGDEKQYKATYVDDDGKKGEFVVHLLKVKDRLFLDLFPVDPELKQNSFYAVHLMPVHTFLRIELKGQTLRFSLLDSSWIKNFVEENPGVIRHEKIDNAVLLTAQPKELQAFLALYEDNAKAWDERPAMTRKPNGAPAP